MFKDDFPDEFDEAFYKKQFPEGIFMPADMLYHFYQYGKNDLHMGSHMCSSKEFIKFIGEKVADTKTLEIRLTNNPKLAGENVSYSASLEMVKDIPEEGFSIIFSNHFFQSVKDPIYHLN